MFAMEVQIPGMEKIHTELNKAIDRFGSEVVKGVAYRTGQAIRAFAPKGKLSHPGTTLAKSIITKPHGKYTFSVTLGQGLYRPYWYYQEFGFRGHLASKVKHPELAPLKGPSPNVAAIRTKPQKAGGYFIGPAINNIPIYIQREVDAQFERIIGRI